MRNSSDHDAGGREQGSPWRSISMNLGDGPNAGLHFWSDEEWAKIHAGRRPAGAIRFGSGWAAIVRDPPSRSVGLAR